MVLYSFIFFLLLFILIGLASTFQSKKNNSDYLMASRSISPLLTALSAISTNNSGYMFIGMIGYTYISGLQSLWLMIGWVLGDLSISFLVHKKLRIMAENRDFLSFGGVLSRWQPGTDFKKLRVLVGVITLIFLGIYAAAQFKAGSKALHVLLGWDYSTGAIIGSIIVFLYCLAGGIRASIWTDAAQSVVMLGAMSMLFFVSISEVGGFDQYLSSLNSVSPTFMSLKPSGLEIDSSLGVLLFVMGWVFGGFGSIGQPHIMVRFMAVDRPKHMTRTRTYYYLWYVVFYALTIGVGLSARLLLPDMANFDAELALPTISQQLLPEILVGVVLAGIFAATMSTADSQILSCSSAFTRDIISKRTSLLTTKLATAGVTIGALFIALYGSPNVFNLVIMAWAVLASGFAPLIILYALNKTVSETTGIIMIVGGVGTALLWSQWGLSSSIYAAAPGMLAGLVLGGVLIQTQWNRV